MLSILVFGLVIFVWNYSRRVVRAGFSEAALHPEILQRFFHRRKQNAVLRQAQKPQTGRKETS